MSDPTRHDRLLDDLAGTLRPVRRLPAPGLRALAWCGAALALGLAMAPMSDTAALAARLGVADLRLAALGAVLTAAAAAFAAFQSSVPGRSAAWALLPLPPLVLWLGSSGLGCLRGWIAPGVETAAGPEMVGCFGFLMLVSLPLSVLLVVMLRKACPLRPTLTAALAGLAASAAAAALLVPFHPHDATATDLAIHLAAVGLVIGLNGALGGRLLDRDRRASG